MAPRPRSKVDRPTSRSRPSDAASERGGRAQRLVALLRAINVGGHIVKMEALRGHFETMGFTGVETFIASGNVIFDGDPARAAALEQRIERHLRDALGYEVATFLRTPAELAASVAYDPFPGSGAGGAGYPMYIAFTGAAVNPDAERALLAFRNDIDDFRVHGREIYWASRGGMGQSKFSGARLEKIIGMPATARNVTTVRKLATLTGGARALAPPGG